jgi:electron transport complex protein RnfC
MTNWLTRKIFPFMHKEIPSQQAISEAGLVTSYILPLVTNQNTWLNPTIAIGERVLKYQSLTALNDYQKPPLHAPTSGIIREIAERPIVHATLKSAPCIILEADGLDQAQAITPLEWKQCSSEQLRQACHQAGVIGLGGAGFPSVLKTQSSKIETVIINGVECEPYITADDRLMQERAAQIIEGALILQKMVQAQKVIIAIEKDKAQAVERMQRCLPSDEAIEIKVVPNGYPSGSEKQLIYFLSHIEIAADRLPSEFGFVMFNVGTAYAVYDAIVQGKPLISRVVTLYPSQNVDIRIGTPIDTLIDNAQDTIIQGGNLMGIPVENHAAPVTKVTSCLWVNTQSVPKKEQPCIRCGFCASVCPVNLLPQQLYWFVQGKQNAVAQENGLLDCIECGACAYVCPSEISLVDYYRQAKQEIKKVRLEQEQAAQAKQHYEARNDRLSRVVERTVIGGETVASALETADKKAVILAALKRARERKGDGV